MSEDPPQQVLRSEKPKLHTVQDPSAEAEGSKIFIKKEIYLSKKEGAGSQQAEKKEKSHSKDYY